MDMLSLKALRACRKSSRSEDILKDRHMFRFWLLLSVTGVVASGPLQAGEMIHIEKLTKAELRETLKAAPDDAIIEYQGSSKTKAEWRRFWLTKVKPFDPAKLEELAHERQAKFEAAAKALNDEQDRAIAKENAAVDAEFEALKAR
jgi:hypothetical protein